MELRDWETYGKAADAALGSDGLTLYLSDTGKEHATSLIEVVQDLRTKLRSSQALNDHLRSQISALKNDHIMSKEQVELQTNSVLDLEDELINLRIENEELKSP
jgi:hypothetical protein